MAVFQCILIAQKSPTLQFESLHLLATTWIPILVCDGRRIINGMCEQTTHPHICTSNEFTMS